MQKETENGIMYILYEYGVWKITNLSILNTIYLQMVHILNVYTKHLSKCQLVTA
jgi:hypothetical protein